MMFVPQVRSAEAVAGPRIQSPSVATGDFIRGRQIQQLGRAMQSLGGQTVRVAGQFQDTHDAATAQRADNQAFELVQRILRDPDRGYLHSVGSDAVEQREETFQEIDRAMTAISGNIESRGARDMFQRASETYRRRASSAIDAHAARENRAHLAGQLQAAQANRRFEYAETFGMVGPTLDDPEEVREELLGVVSENAAEYSDLVGDSPEEAAQRERESRMQLHGAALEFLGTTGDTQGTRRYIEQWSDEIDPTMREGFRQAARKVDDTRREVTAKKAREDRAARWAVASMNRGQVSGATATQTVAFAMSELMSGVQDGTVDAQTYVERREWLERFEQDRRRSEDVESAAAVADVLALVDANPGISMATLAHSHPEQFALAYALAPEWLRDEEEAHGKRLAGQRSQAAEENFYRLEELALGDRNGFMRAYPSREALVRGMPGFTSSQRNRIVTLWERMQGGEQSSLYDDVKSALARFPWAREMSLTRNGAERVRHEVIESALRAARRDGKADTEQDLQGWLMNQLAEQSMTWEVSIDRDKATGALEYEGKIPPWAMDVVGMPELSASRTTPSGEVIRFGQAGSPEVEGYIAYTIGLWDGEGNKPAFNSDQMRKIENAAATLGHPGTVTEAAAEVRSMTSRNIPTSEMGKWTHAEMERLSDVNARGHVAQFTDASGRYVPPPNPMADHMQSAEYYIAVWERSAHADPRAYAARLANLWAIQAAKLGAAQNRALDAQQSND